MIFGGTLFKLIMNKAEKHLGSLPEDIEGSQVG
jgi:hypothetical protein